VRKPLYERVVMINDKLFGYVHPETAASLNNLALLLQTQHDLAAARSLFERALAMGDELA
jgi:hypothetical protein